MLPAPVSPPSRPRPGTVARNLDRILTANRASGAEPATALALGRKLGHTNGAYISHILGGRKHPGPEMTARIAEILGVPASELNQPLQNHPR